MSDIVIRKQQHAGCITLQRPDALNALTYPMCLTIADALASWKSDPDIRVILLDALGERAFCAGGDIAEMYRCGMAGNFAYGQKYWRDEYCLNAAIGSYPKPIISFLQGFTMGGGVGIGCHGSHRIVGKTSKVAMPECSIGLVPDVGGSLLLALSPSRLGECLGLTGWRMNAHDAIFVGFADYFVPECHWPDLKREICTTGSSKPVNAAAESPPQGELQELQGIACRLFAQSSLPEIMDALERDGGDFAERCLKPMHQNSPLSMACTLKMIRQQRSLPTLRHALSLEYRYVHRSLEHADFLEGIRARIVDKDNRPVWRHSSVADVTDAEVDRMLAPLGEAELVWQ